MVLSMYSAGQDLSGLKIHVSAIATFLRRHEWLWRAHVVDFFHVSIVPLSLFSLMKRSIASVMFLTHFACVKSGLNVQAKLWERVDEHWNSALRIASVDTLLRLPSGVIQVRAHTSILTGFWFHLLV